MASDEPSTRFPFINLEKALARAQQMFAGNRAGAPMAVPTAFELWGYGPKSSGAFQTVGALKGYGLIEDEGANADRKLRMSDAARRYFLDERDDVRAGMLATFALNPPLFRALWDKDKWSEGLPADTVARSHLKLDRHLNDQSARAVLGIFKENITFAGLKGGTETPESVEFAPIQDDGPEPKPEPSLSLMEKAMLEHMRGAPTADRTPPPAAADNLVDARMVGDRVLISANVDLKGLRRLRKQLAMFETMLTMDDDDEEEDLVG